MPGDLRFLLDMESGFAGHTEGEERVVMALRLILRGGHLSYDAALTALSAVLEGKVIVTAALWLPPSATALEVSVIVGGVLADSITFK